jgi:ATP phosphoribosyltransferase
MLTIALAKGRTTDDVMPLWTSAGLPKPDGMDESRSLVFHLPAKPAAGAPGVTYPGAVAPGVTDPSAADPGVADRGTAARVVIAPSAAYPGAVARVVASGAAARGGATAANGATLGDTDDAALRFLLAKPADVPTYVSFGVADIGIVGEDVVLESGREVYELLDLKKAECRLCVAGRPESRHQPARRVATKYPRLADQYFRSRGEAVEIIPLGGSIELAAVIGLADRIFDLVQTGGTLVANGLIVFDEVMNVSARLVANRSSYRTKRRLIDEISARLAESIQERGSWQ